MRPSPMLFAGVGMRLALAVALSAVLWGLFAWATS